MHIPKRKKHNTIGVKFVQGIIKDEHYQKIIEGILSLTDEDILKIAELNYTHFMFKVSTENYNRICRENIDRFFRLDEETNIIIQDLSNYSTEVSVFNIGLELEAEDIVKILKLFGVIERKYYYRQRPNVNYFAARGTGRMILRMELKESIPSTIYIKDTCSYIHVKYEGQPPTCHRCGSQEHKIRSCDRHPGTGNNVIDLDQLDTENDDSYSDNVSKSENSGAGAGAASDEEEEQAFHQKDEQKTITDPGL